MDIKKVKCAYFSPTGNVKKVVMLITDELVNALKAERIASAESDDNVAGLNPEVFEFDFLSPESRERVLECREGDLLIIGVPVFAGRVPNKILPYIQSGFRTSSADEFKENKTKIMPSSSKVGCRSICLPVVCFGNRDYGDALSELAMEMDNAGFMVIGGAAVATEHSFCPEIGTGRPDESDIEEIRNFARNIAEKIEGQRTNIRKDGNCHEKQFVTGTNDNKCAESPPNCEFDSLEKIPGNMPPGPYYTPLKEDGEPAVFLKAKPITDMMKCDGCMRCAERCPMGSISKDNPEEVPGICIKCQACIKVCPKEAKYFDNPDFISHKTALGVNFKRRAENVFVL